MSSRASSLDFSITCPLAGVFTRTRFCSDVAGGSFGEKQALHHHHRHRHVLPHPNSKAGIAAVYILLMAGCHDVSHRLANIDLGMRTICTEGSGVDVSMYGLVLIANRNSSNVYGKLIYKISYQYYKKYHKIPRI